MTKKLDKIQFLVRTILVFCDRHLKGAIFIPYDKNSLNLNNNDFNPLIRQSKRKARLKNLPVENKIEFITKQKASRSISANIHNFNEKEEGQPKNYELPNITSSDDIIRSTNHATNYVANKSFQARRSQSTKTINKLHRIGHRPIENSSHSTGQKVELIRNKTDYLENRKVVLKKIVRSKSNKYD